MSELRNIYGHTLVYVGPLYDIRQASATDIFSLIAVARAYGVKLVMDSLNKQKFVDGDGVVVNRYKAYITGLLTSREQDENESD